MTESVKLPPPRLPDGYDKYVFSNLLLCQGSGATDGSGNLFLVNSQGFTLPFFWNHGDHGCPIGDERMGPKFRRL